MALPSQSVRNLVKVDGTGRNCVMPKLAVIDKTQQCGVHDF